jgi:hypothetical protein
MTYRSRSGSSAPVRKLGWRRVAAGLLVPLIAVLVLQIRYYAPHHVEDVNLAVASTEQPLAASASMPPIALAPPQPGADRSASAVSIVIELRPLRLSQERAPPSPAL